MKLFAGIILTALSMAGLVHQGTVIKPSQVAIIFPKPAALSAAAPAAVIAPAPAPSRAAAITPSPAATGIVLGTSTTDGVVTQSELQTAIQQASDQLRQLIYANAGTIGQGQYSTGGDTNNIALSNRIDRLNGTTLSNVVINGVQGLAASDIPDLSSKYLTIAAAGNAANGIFLSNVGVGTTSPTALLTLDSTSTTGTILRISNGSTGGHVYDFLETGSANTGGAGRLDFFDRTANTARLSIAANGNVGVGTTSPFTNFAVNGSGYLSGSLNVGDAATTRANLGLAYATTIDIFNTSIVAWGDSLTAGNEDGTGVTYPNSLSTDLGGRLVTNKGVGGQTSTQIGVREGGVSATATISGGQIPASGGVTVTFPTGYEPVTSQGPAGGVSGTISGVYGTVTLSGATYTFTRSAMGSIVSVSSAPFMVDTGTLNNGTVIIWAGRNDIANMSQVEADVASMVSDLGANKHYLILSVLNEEGEPSGSTNYNDIIAINTFLASTYPGHYLDIRAYLVQRGLSDAGITPTTQDNTDIASDIPPTSLRFDAIHPNAIGYQLIAQQVANFITGTLDTTSKSVLQPGNLTAIFASPFPIGSTAPSAGYFTVTGVGTTSPTDTFDVKGTIGLQAANGEIYTRNGNANSIVNLDFPEISTAVPAVRLFANTNSSSAGLLQIFKGDGTASIQTQLSNRGVSFINAVSGNVGIATTTASDIFDVNGNIGLTNSTSRFIYLRGGNAQSVLNIDFPELTSTAAQLRLFRGTNTTANNSTAMGVFLFKGDGSGSTQTYLATNNNSYLNALSGNVSIGTSTPYSRLTVWGSDAASSTSAFSVINNASTTEFQVFDGGNAQLAGTLTQNSDQRLKTNITSLDASSSLAAIDALNPVTFNWIDPTEGTAPQIGFIAQQVQQLFPSLISTTSPTALTPGGTLGLNYIGLISPIVSAIQALSSEVNSLSATVAGFATSFHTQQLCVGSTCINQEQLANLLALEQQGQVQISAPTPPTIFGTTTPPSISIQGDNPSVIQIGDTYTDLGAIATDNQGTTLGYKTFLNGTLVSNIVINTTQVATDTLDYVATDTWGNTSTSTRTIVVEASPSIITANEASTTASSSPSVQ